jgi:hypothetical protein
VKNILSTFLLFLSIFYYQCFAQSNIKFNSLPPTETSQYFQPLATYLGTYFSTGNYYTADVSSTFGFRFSIIGMWSVVPDNQKTFNPEPGLPGVTDVAPTATVFGTKASYFLGNEGYFVYPTGLSLKAVPLGIYQFAGSLFNTELMLRFFPNSKFGDAKVGVFGIGVKHEISSHIPLLPVNVAVQILYNQLNFEYTGNETDKYGKLTSKNFAINAHASKTFLEMFTVYTGLQYESSSSDFTYYFDDPDNFYPTLGNRIQDVKIDGDNHFRYTLGGAIKLGFFVINTDMNIASFTTYSLGLSLDF